MRLRSQFAVMLSRPSNPAVSFVHSLSDNELQPQGAKHVADAIATNTTLKELKYALSHPQPCCQYLL